ncbi:MAG: HigA family addiction module antidote protein [Gemmatimonadetes bacterium]|nr:HigA family addiction module antidote protein [Gemmatimonadota bacterium]MYK54318.1 HigA family addiction module antidote protein [Gemmatimonadota bacterium]
MTIKRAELDRREIDFSDVVSGHQLSPVHPGEILRDEFLIPMNLSVTRLAQGIKVSEKDLDAIVHGINGITIDTALRLGHYFGMTPEFWMNLQTHYDLDVAEHTVRLKIEREIEPYAEFAPSSDSARQMDTT